MKVRQIITAVAFSGLISGAAFAQDITFKFNNPSFGGNSFNSAHLLSLAEIQQQHQPDAGGGAAPGNAATSAFVRQLESRLLANVSAGLVEQITSLDPGSEPQTLTVEGQRITFERTDTHIVVSITDLLTLGTTGIEIPASLIVTPN